MRATRRGVLAGALAIPGMAGLPRAASAGTGSAVLLHDSSLEAGRRFAAAYGGAALPIEGDRIRFARALFERAPALVVGVSRAADAVLIEDVGVPIPRIPELIAAVERIAADRDTLVPVIGHAGDGNFHPLVTFDPDDRDAALRAAMAFDEIMRAALQLGGTVTGEHGIGTLKAAHLVQQLGEDVFDLTRRVKQALDPLGILNPGKWV